MEDSGRASIDLACFRRTMRNFAEVSALFGDVSY